MQPRFTSMAPNMTHPPTAHRKPALSRPVALNGEIN